MAQKSEPIYPYHEWDIIETEFNLENNYRNESIFALGNGTIGMRGNFEEGLAPGKGLEGNYINGFYESEVMKYPEIAYAFAEKSQTMLNVTNSKIIKLYVEDEYDSEMFSLLDGQVLAYARALRLKTGVLERTVVWRSPKGREVRIVIKRLVSLKRQHLAAIEYEVTPLNFSGEIQLVSALDGNVTNLTADRDPRVGSGLQGRVLSVEDPIAKGGFGAMKQRTQHTGMVLVCAMLNQIEGDAQIENWVDEFTVQTAYTFPAPKGEPIRLTKYIAYVTTQHYAESDLFGKATETVNTAAAAGFEQLAAEQAEFMAEFWNKADVTIQGDVPLQQGLRFNTFHLLQSVGRDGKTNIAAKGLTGEGYEGHYFWDTEMYVIPFFLYHHPDIARKLLEYRYSILDKARERAQQMAHPKGALFAWRSINGEECSAYFPAGTAQYHIDADIAFAIKRYVEATGDTDFLVQGGAEILFETARLWADLGVYIDGKGFCINEVTGPDEYSALVDNNCYTNLMAQVNLQYAHDIAHWLMTYKAEAFQQISAKIGLELVEVEDWHRAADAMYLPYDDTRRIYKQDDTFLDKEPWDFAHTPPENYPLLLHYHPLVIYRHQVCKQADFVLAMCLLGQRFDLDEKRRNYDYYEKVTTHNSSLSTCIFSIVASEIGYFEKAYQYFMNTARMDLDDYHGNVKAGVHIANMAGAWMCVVNGFAGLRVYDGVLSLNPYLPVEWGGYSFKVVYKGSLLRVSVNKTQTIYELVAGEKLDFVHHGEKISLLKGESIIR